MYSIYLEDFLLGKSWSYKHQVFKSWEDIENTIYYDLAMSKFLENPVIEFPLFGKAKFNSINEKLGFIVLLDLIKNGYIKISDNKDISKCEKIVDDFNNKNGKFWSGNNLVASYIYYLEQKHSIKISLKFDKEEIVKIESELFVLQNAYLFNLDSYTNFNMLYDIIRRITRKSKILDQAIAFNIISTLLIDKKVSVIDFSIVKNNKFENFLNIHNVKKNMQETDKEFKDTVPYFSIYTDLSIDKEIFKGVDGKFLKMFGDKLSIDGSNVPIFITDFSKRSLYDNSITKLSLFVSHFMRNTSDSYKKMVGFTKFTGNGFPDLENYRYCELIARADSDNALSRNGYKINIISKDADNLNCFGTDIAYDIGSIMYQLFQNDEHINYRKRASDFNRFWSIIFNDSIIIEYNKCEINILQEGE